MPTIQMRPSPRMPESYVRAMSDKVRTLADVWLGVAAVGTLLASLGIVFRPAGGWYSGRWAGTPLDLVTAEQAESCASDVMAVLGVMCWLILAAAPLALATLAIKGGRPWGLGLLQAWAFAVPLTAAPCALLVGLSLANGVGWRWGDALTLVLVGLVALMLPLVVFCVHTLTTICHERRTLDTCRPPRGG